MLNKKLGFTQKIVFLHFFAMLFIVMFTIIYFHTTIRFQIEESEGRRAMDVAESLSGSLPVLMELGLIGEIEAEVNKTVAKNKDISSVRLFDIGGNIIIKNGNGGYGPTFDISVPVVTSSGGQKIGSIHLSYSKREYEKLVSKQFRVFVALILVAIIFAMLSAIYIRKKLQPLYALAEELTKIDINAPKLTATPPKDNDELRVIHTNIQDAFNKITEYQVEIQKVNENLENLVDVRTKSLKLAIDELRDKEEMLVFQSRFSAMGEMIANIAHQWRQPLNIIKSSVSLLMFQKQMGRLSDESFSQGTEGVINQIDYLSQTIEDFREFYRDDEHGEFSVVSSIKKSFDLISSALKNNFIHYEFKNTGDYSLVGSQGRLVQVIVNIVNNAKDAIVASKVNGVILVNFKVEKGVGIVEICDNAGGIDEDIIGRIFEPYFTTKHKSQGTGLGLYMSKQIIEKHFNSKISAVNRSVEINSNKYNGACFIIELTNQ